MPDSLVFGRTFKLLGKALDISARRHSQITSNIANIDTVGYKSRDIDFHQTLKNEMGRSPGSLGRTHQTHYKHSKNFNVSTMVVKDSGNPDTPDSVDIDVEMTHLAENNIVFRTSAELLSRKIAKLKHVITEGGR